MGGMGSGNYLRLHAAETTEDYWRLDVRRWQREGLLSAGRVFRWQWNHDGVKVASINVRVGPDAVFVSYGQRADGEDWKVEQYPIQLEWTACHYGGRRAWFLCPSRGCGRRVAILYGGAVFACRHCHRLAYPSQREGAHDRAARRAERIRERLGWHPGILTGSGCKPKWMRWRTFERLVAEHDWRVGDSLARVAKKFGLAAC
ncbi:MAG: hypothetical protein WCJ69_17265 [Betaproteobacteria bacterium]